MISHFDFLCSETQIKYLLKLVSAHKRRSQQKRQLSQFNGTLVDFVIGSNTNLGVLKIETWESQTVGLFNNPDTIIDVQISACQNQVVGNTFEDKIRKAAYSAVKTVENCMYDAISRVMDNADIPRVEMTVRLITVSSGYGLNSTVRNSDRRDFKGNTENTPLKLASSRIDLTNDHDRTDETRDIKNFEDGEFLALRPNYDRKAHAHHMARRHTAPHTNQYP